MPEPSRANWDPDQPRECAGCGAALRITVDRILFRRYPVRESWCDRCSPKWKLMRAWWPTAHLLALLAAEQPPYYLARA